MACGVSMNGRFTPSHTAASFLTSPGSDILTSTIHKKMWQVHPDKPNVHFVEPSVFSEFRGKLEDAEAAVGTLSMKLPQMLAFYTFRARKQHTSEPSRP